MVKNIYQFNLFALQLIEDESIAKLLNKKEPLAEEKIRF